MTLEYAIRCKFLFALLPSFPAVQFYFCILEYFGILMVVNCFVVVFVNTYLLAIWLFQSALVVYLQAISNSNVVAHPMIFFFIRVL